MNLELEELTRIALVFLRVGSMLFAMPFFGDSVVSNKIKTVLSCSLTVGVYIIVPTDWLPNKSYTMIEFVLIGCWEIILGLSIGYLSKMFFEGLIMAASFVGYQMGFGTANILMPGTDSQMNAFTSFHRIFILLVFLSLNLHYIYIHAITKSFILIPAGQGLPNGALVEFIINTTSEIFLVSLQLAAPMLVALLFSMAALGLVARTVPQMNVFTLSFPLSFFCGLIVYLSMTPFLPQWLRAYYLKKSEELILALNIISN